MRILSMTATFGKLEGQTLTLQPGLNIIEAPNEWGKSTWCAFLVAMLYGIDSRARDSSKNPLADKNRYDPWSGQPMSGSIRLLWQGRDITIQRRSTKRAQFREFSAYDTLSGAPIGELTADNCGQVLLGVEKEVFQRSGFLKLADLPVTQHEALRRRLNALVTTGDESEAADQLEKRLRDLKNECYVNRSKGRLPQAQAQKTALEEKQRQLADLHTQARRLEDRRQELEAHQARLQNHLDALRYTAAQQTQARLHSARRTQQEAQAALDALIAQCAQLPDRAEAQHRLQQLEDLRRQTQALELEAQMLPAAPGAPEPPQGAESTDPRQHLDQVRAHRSQARDLEKALDKKPPLLWPLAALLALAAIGLFFLHWAAGAAAAVAALGALAVHLVLTGRHRRTQAALRTRRDRLSHRYGAEDPALWEAAAETYRRAWEDYLAQCRTEEAQQAALAQRAKSLGDALARLPGEGSLAQRAESCRRVLDLWDQEADARRNLQKATELTQALSGADTAPKAPAQPDSLSYTEADTLRMLSDCGADLRQNHQRSGHCQGQMEALGSEQALQKALEEVTDRIRRLETTLQALALAQETLQKAREVLQQRFAPRITQRARERFSRLTGGRYDRLTLTQELSVNLAARDETTLHSSLWRSDGTVDQLYLALRLAVAEELIPDAPLILDDALVRFDDTRLRQALTLLQEEGQSRQVLLFTCQSREKQCLAP